MLNAQCVNVCGRRGSSFSFIFFFLLLLVQVLSYLQICHKKKKSTILPTNLFSKNIFTYNSLIKKYPTHKSSYLPRNWRHVRTYGHTWLETHGLIFDFTVPSFNLDNYVRFRPALWKCTKKYGKSHEGWMRSFSQRWILFSI